MKFSAFAILPLLMLVAGCNHSLKSFNGLSFSKAPLTTTVDSIVVVKHNREMVVFNQHKPVKAYHIRLGFTPIGKKHFEHDGKTPEGLYHINGKNPNSVCHKNLGVSYPNEADRKYAAAHSQPTGGDIKIHGLPNGKGRWAKAFSLVDWTDGCVAVNDVEMDEIYASVNIGAYINILP